VEDKKRKVAEAVERGQLDLNPSRSARPLKRRKIDPQTVGADGQGFDARGGKTLSGRNPNISRRWRQRRGQEPVPEANLASTPPLPANDVKESDDDDAAPEELSSKMPESVQGDDTTPSTYSQPPRPQEWRKLKEPQPRGPPKNPLASRPALLRNLLLPEIRMTVSNLSQAIRFLVDNDFLRKVELKPGQAAEQEKIHVLNSEETN